MTKDLITFENLLKEIAKVGIATSTRKNIYNEMCLLYSTDTTIEEKYEFFPSAKTYKLKFIEKSTKLNSVINLPIAPRRIEEKMPMEESCNGGIYLIGETIFNPFTREEFYWIKVGESSNIYNRMKGYATENPQLYKIDALVCEDLRFTQEYICHKILEHIAIEKATESNEWFRVTRELYLEICKKGFSFFF